MREGWAGIFKCVMPVRSGLVVNDGQIGDGQQKGEEALRKKREKKKVWPACDLGGGAA